MTHALTFMELTSREDPPFIPRLLCTTVQSVVQRVVGSAWEERPVDAALQLAAHYCANSDKSPVKSLALDIIAALDTTHAEWWVAMRCFKTLCERLAWSRSKKFPSKRGRASWIKNRVSMVLQRLQGCHHVCSLLKLMVVGCVDPFSTGSLIAQRGKHMWSSGCCDNPRCCTRFVHVVCEHVHRVMAPPTEEEKNDIFFGECSWDTNGEEPFDFTDTSWLRAHPPPQC